MDPVTIENQATLLYNNVTTNSNTAVTRILSLYDLTATKEALLDTYTPGQTITYVTRVENTGSAPLYNLTIVDNLADGLIRYINTSVEGYLNGSPIEIAVQTTTNSATFKVNSIVEPTDNVLIIFETTTPTSNPDTLTNTQTITANGGSVLIKKNKVFKYSKALSYLLLVKIKVFKCLEHILNHYLLFIKIKLNTFLFSFWYF